MKWKADYIGIKRNPADKCCFKIKGLSSSSRCELLE